MSKKYFRSIMGMVLAVIMMLSFAVIPSSAAKAALNKSAVTLVAGRSVTLTVNGTSRRVKWSSDDETIATVTKRGRVTAVKVGTTAIKASFGESVLKCNITVRAGSIASSESKLNVEVGKTASVLIKAVGLHDIRVTNSDSGAVKAALSGKFDGDYTTLEVKGISDGTAKLKIYANGHEDSIYKYVDVVVGKGKPVKKITVSGITISVDSVEVNENCTEKVTITASEELMKKLTIVSTAKSKFDIETSYLKGTASVKINGLMEGDANLRIFDPNDKNTDIFIPVTVTNNAYDVVVWNRQPNKRKSSDIIYTADDGKITRYYVLEPEDGDPAHAESLLSKKAGTYRYWTVYESRPKKINSDDVILSRSDTYKGKKVTRYLIVEKNYDEAYTNSVFGRYFGVYDYYKIYASSPLANAYGDKMLIYEYYVDKVKETRFILMPQDYDILKAEKIWDSYAAKNKIEEWKSVIM